MRSYAQVEQYTRRQTHCQECVLDEYMCMLNIECLIVLRDKDFSTSSRKSLSEKKLDERLVGHVVLVSSVLDLLEQML